jgi:flagellar protein FliO/FliZ
MANGLAGADLFRMLGSFALVLALMAALLWTLRKLQSRLNTQHAGRRLNVIETLSVGPRQKFALLRVGQHEVLVGITASQMTALAHWPEGADHSASPSLNATPTPTGEPHVA